MLVCCGRTAIGGVGGDSAYGLTDSRYYILYVSCAIKPPIFFKPLEHHSTTRSAISRCSAFFASDTSDFRQSLQTYLVFAQA